MLHMFETNTKIQTKNIHPFYFMLYMFDASGKIKTEKYISVLLHVTYL